MGVKEFSFLKCSSSSSSCHGSLGSSMQQLLSYWSRLVHMNENERCASWTNSVFSILLFPIVRHSFPIEFFSLFLKPSRFFYWFRFFFTNFEPPWPTFYILEFENKTIVDFALNTLVIKEDFRLKFLGLSLRTKKESADVLKLNFFLTNGQVVTSVLNLSQLKCLKTCPSMHFSSTLWKSQKWDF